MAVARYRFHGEIESFLARERRGRAFDFDAARRATLKHAIESLGVPHTEIGRVLVDGEAAPLDRLVAGGESVEVYPVEPTPAARAPRFLADVHLGGLARRLRLLGFDTAWHAQADDAALARQARDEGRVLLTRDRELLKHREVRTGCYVRALDTEGQTREVLARFGLHGQIRAFTRCLECNGPLEPVAKADVAHRLPPTVASLHDAFVRCTTCDKVYWKGSHWARMRTRALGWAEDGNMDR